MWRKCPQLANNPCQFGVGGVRFRAGDLVIASVVTGPPWSTTGFKVTVPLLGTLATWIKTTQSRVPALVVGVAALTAGKCNLYVEGIMA